MGAPSAKVYQLLGELVLDSEVSSYLCIDENTTQGVECIQEYMMHINGFKAHLDTGRVAYVHNARERYWQVILEKTGST